VSRDPRPGDLYGMLAEFADADKLRDAAARAYGAGYRQIDAFSPYPVEGLSRALGFRQTRLPWVVLGGAAFGGITGYLMQYVTAVIVYPLNIGGRPAHSWPSFVPVTFEMTILCGALAAVLGMLALNSLPTPHHPVFHVAAFERASSDRFFLCIKAKDERFDVASTRAFLDELNPDEVIDVEV